jgi:serine/threonine protein kinase
MRRNRTHSQLIAERFEIRSLERDLLGRGSMGEVYRAIDGDTGELVAVKALDPGVVARTPGILDRFVREGEALRQLDHPNIVRMVTAVEGEGQYYLVMEYVAAQSLSCLARRRRGSWRWIVGVQESRQRGLRP